MRKICKRVLICFMLCTAIWGIMLLKDRDILNQELIRFHVIANSDSKSDQTVKLQVRDAVLSSISEDMKKMKSKKEAEQYIRTILPKLQHISSNILKQAGLDYSCAVQYCKESFPIRDYDTFSLPSGVYDTLLIILGEGSGQNWWCVSFPTLCAGATKEAFSEITISSGLPKRLSSTLSDPHRYQIRFYLLDKLGELEKIIFSANDCPNLEEYDMISKTKRG